MKSLFNLCVEAVVASLESHYAGSIHFLPSQLKSQLLEVACKRGNLGSNILHSLLHSGVKKLDLNESSVSDDSLAAVSKCHQLHTLDLNYYKKFSNFENITTAALVDLFPNLHFLAVLHMQYCHALTDDVMCSIAKNCPCLSVLDVGGCSTITDKSLKKLTEKLQHISSLNIAESQVTELGILALVQGFCGKSLLELHMDKCKGVTNFAIEAITMYCINLKFLQFHGCPVTEDSWHSLDTLVSKSKVLQLSWTIY